MGFFFEGTYRWVLVVVALLAGLLFATWLYGWYPFGALQAQRQSPKQDVLTSLSTTTPVTGSLKDPTPAPTAGVATSTTSSPVPIETNSILDSLTPKP